MYNKIQFTYLRRFNYHMHVEHSCSTLKEQPVIFAQFMFKKLQKISRYIPPERWIKIVVISHRHDYKRDPF